MQFRGLAHIRRDHYEPFEHTNEFYKSPSQEFVCEIPLYDFHWCLDFGKILEVADMPNWNIQHIQVDTRDGMDKLTY